MILPPRDASHGFTKRLENRRVSVEVERDRMRGWKASAWAEYAREPSDPGNPIRQQLPRTWNEKSHVPPSPPRFLSILARISHFRDPHPANSNFLIARQIFYRVSVVAPSLNGGTFRGDKIARKYSQV